MTILNCRVFRCKLNDRGECRLEKITLQDVGSLTISNVICIEAVPKDDDAEPLDLETAWGIPEKDLPEQEPKDHFAMKDNEREFKC